MLERFFSDPLVQALLLFALVLVLALWALEHTAGKKPGPLRFSSVRHLNAVGWFAALFAPVCVALFLGNLFLLWRVGETIHEKLGADPDLLRWYVLAFVGLMTTLGGILGTPLALIRVFTTERQTRTAEQSHITDQINKAVEGLGAVKAASRQRRRENGKLAYEEGDFGKPIHENINVPNIEVRVGAIYALERIAQDSQRDHIQIMESLPAGGRLRRLSQGAFW